MAEEVRTVVAVIRPEVAANGASAGITELTSKLKLLERAADGTLTAVEKIGEARIAGEKQSSAAKKLIERFVDGAKQARQYESAINQLQRTMEAMTLDQQIATIEGINAAYRKLPQALKLVANDLDKLEAGAKGAGDAFQASALLVGRAQAAIRAEIAETARAAEEANVRLATNRVNAFLSRDARMVGPQITGGANRIVGQELGEALEPQFQARAERARQLVDSYDKVGAALRRLAQDETKLTHDLKIGDITVGEYKAAMDGLNKALADLSGATAANEAAERKKQAALDASARSTRELAALQQQATAANTQEAYRKLFGVREFEQISAMQRRDYEKHWQDMLAIRDRAASRPLRDQIERLTGVERRGTALDPARRRADAESAFNPANDEKFKADQASIQALIGSYDRLGVAMRRIEADERRFSAAFADGKITSEQYRQAMQATATAKTELSRTNQVLTASMNQLGGAHQNLYTRNLILQSALVNTFQSMAAGQGVFSTLFVQGTQAVGAFGNLRIGLLATAAAGAVLVGAIIGAARAIATTGDAAVMARGRMEQFLGSAQEATRVYQNLQALGAQTGVAANDSAGVFSRLLIGGEQLGASTAQMERLLETFQKLGVLGSATNQELIAGMRQFTQALGKGKLDGDELRSVLENIPEVIRLIGRNLGKTTEELRTMGANGELTSRLVFGALLRGSDEVDARFGRLPLTMNRAMGQVRVAIEGVLDQMNSWLGLSDRLAQMLAGVAGKLTEFREWLKSLENPNNTQNNATRADRAVRSAEPEVKALEERVEAAQKRLDELRNRPAVTVGPGGLFGQSSALGAQLQELQRLQLALEEARQNLAQARERNVAAQAADAPRVEGVNAMAEDLRRANERATAERERLERLRAIAAENDKILKSAEGEPQINREARDRTLRLREELEMVQQNVDRARHELDMLSSAELPGSELRQLDLQKQIEESLQRQILLESGLEQVEIERLRSIEQLSARQRREEAKAAREIQQLEAAMGQVTNRALGGGVSEEIRAYLAIGEAITAYTGKLSEAERNSARMTAASQAQATALDNLSERWRLHVEEINKQADEANRANQVRALEAQNTPQARAEIERLRQEQALNNVQLQREQDLLKLNRDLTRLSAEDPARAVVLAQVTAINEAYDRLAASIRAAADGESAFARARRETLEAANQLVRRFNTPESINETARQDSDKVIAAQRLIAEEREQLAARLRDIEVLGIGTDQERLALQERINRAVQQESTMASVLLQIEQTRVTEMDNLDAAARRTAERNMAETRRLEAAIGRAAGSAEMGGTSTELRAYQELANAIQAYTDKHSEAERNQLLLTRATEGQMLALTNLAERWRLHTADVEKQTREVELAARIRVLEAQNTTEARIEIERLRTERQLENIELQRTMQLSRLTTDFHAAQEGPAKEALRAQIDLLNAAYRGLAEGINAANTAEAASARQAREGAQRVASIVQRVNTPETIDYTARVDTAAVAAERERFRVETVAAQRQLSAFEVQGIGSAQDRQRLQAQILEGQQQELVLTGTIAGIERDRLKAHERLNAAQTRAAARASKEIETLERAIGRGSESADRTGASSEMRAYRQITVALAAYNAKVPLAARDTQLVTDAQRAQVDVLGDLTRRWETHTDQINQSTRDMELQNQIRRLEADGSREARVEIDRLTTARQLERLELQRQTDLRQLNIDLTLAQRDADLAARQAVEARIAGINSAYERQRAAISAPENQRSAADLADQQKRALDRATKESADFLYDAFSGKINSMGELLGNTLKRGLADALAEEFIRPLLRPIIQTIVGGFSGAVGGGGMVNLLNRGSNAIGFGDIAGPNGFGARLNTAAVSAFPSVFATAPAAAKAGGAWTGSQEAFNKPGVTGTASASAESATGAPTATDVLGGIGAGFGIGMALGSLTAQGNPHKQQNAMIGAAGGAIAGALIGMAIPAVGPIIGALIGGALGGGAGGLIGPQPSNMEGFAEFNFATGKRTTGGQTGEKFSAANRGAAQTMAKQVQTAVDGIAKALDATKPDQGWFRVGTGNRDGIFYDYDPTGQGNWSQATRKRYARGEEETLLTDLLSEFIPGMAGGLSDMLRAAISHTQADSGETILAIADWLGGVYKPLTQLEEPMTDFERALRDLNKTYDNAIIQARQYGLSEDALVAGRARAINQLRQERLDSVAPNATNIITSLADYAADLRTRSDNTGNPMSRFEAAELQFRDVLYGAFNGDYKSLGKVQSSADQYLAQARDIYGTGQGFLTVFNQVSEALGQVGDLDSTSILESAIRDSEKTQTATLVGELQRLTSEVISLKREVQQNGLNPLGGQ